MHRLAGRTSRRHRLALGGAAIFALCIAFAPGGTAPAQAQAASSVSIIDFAFQPASVTVPVGAAVSWTNNGMAPHTSTSSSGGWDSGRLTSGQSFSFTFSQAGSFGYICTIHPSMMGTVVVQAAVASAPAAAAPVAAPPAAPPAAAQPARPTAAPAPAAQRPAAAPAAAAPQAQRPAAAPAAPAAPRPAAAAAPRPQQAAAPAARPAAQAAALPRSGAGGPLAADSQSVLPAAAAGGVFLLGLIALAYRRRQA